MGPGGEAGGRRSHTKEVIGGDAVIVPDLQDQHRRLPELRFFQGKGSRPAPDAHLPLRGQVVEAEYKAPVEIPLPSQGVEVNVCLLLIVLQPLHPATGRGEGQAEGWTPAQRPNLETRSPPACLPTPPPGQPLPQLPTPLLGLGDRALAEPKAQALSP